MPITGNQKALMFARSGLARSGATRSGYFNETVALVVNGIDRSSRLKKATLKITKREGAAGNTATFVVWGFTPIEGQTVVIGNGAINKREFNGTISNLTQAVDNGQVEWRIDCMDRMRQFNKATVSGRYTSQAMHLIALQILAAAAPGFTTNNVATSSPTIDYIEFTDEAIGAALGRLCARISTDWHWYLDAYDDVHLFEGDEGLQNPVPLDETNYTNQHLTYSEDGRLRITRATVEGGGGNTTAPVAAGSTSIPVSECAWYADAGGTVKCGPQRVTYTGRSATSGPGSLTGVPASGAGSLIYDLTADTEVNILVTVDDLVAQAAIVAKEGGDGVYARTFTDRRLSIAGATELATSRLAGTPIASGVLQTRDRFADVGRTLTFDLTVPRGITGTAPIVEAVLARDEKHDRWIRTVTYSSRLKPQLQDAIRSIVASQGAGL